MFDKIDTNGKKILDVTCGSRTIWFNKYNPSVLYCDRRKEQFFDVFYYHGGEKTLINHYMTSIALNSVLSEKVFMLLDGDMDTGYEFNLLDAP